MVEERGDVIGGGLECERGGGGTQKIVLFCIEKEENDFRFFFFGFFFFFQVCLGVLHGATAPLAIAP